MRRLFWLWLGLLFSAVPGLALADVTPAVLGTYRTSTGVYLVDPATYCATTTREAWVLLRSYDPATKAPMSFSSYGSDSSGSSITGKEGECRYDAANPTNAVVVNARYYCPSGSTPTAGLLCTWPESCSGGGVRDPKTGVCSPPPCQAGQTATIRAWVGYATTIQNVDDWLSPRIPSTASDGSNCQIGDLTLVSGSCTVSPDMGGPPYPGSCEFTGTTTGYSSGASDLTFDDPLAPIPCPTGTATGSVNGVSGCYKTSSSTSTSSTATNGDGSTTKTTTTVNPDGSTTTTTTTTNPDGSQTVSRVVTGATPGSGSGPLPGQGSDGDGDGSGTGGGGGGAATSGDSDQAKWCQDNPNAAVCKDKLPIDETGTPDAKTDWNTEQTTLQTAVNAIKDEVERGDWKQIDLGFSWDPPIPSGGCSSVTIFNYSIDICPALSKARELWGWVIYVLAALAIWIRGVRALQGV